MTTHNGKKITQRGGADAGRGDDAHGITPVSRMLSIINKDRVSVPFESTSVGDLHDMRMTEGAAKQSRDAFLATEPEPYLAENYEKAPLSDNPFREDRIS